QQIQHWLGIITLTSLLALGAVVGMSFLWPIMGIVALLLAATTVVGWVISRREQASSHGWMVARGALSWLASLVFSALVLRGLASSVPLWMVALLPLLATLGYVVCWVLTTRAFTRAELMTIFAALVVTSGVST